MIECVNGEGQGCCDICLHTKGFHRYWSNELYYVKNDLGQYLRINENYGDVFSYNDSLKKAAFCHEHVQQVESSRCLLIDWKEDVGYYH